MDKRFGKTEKLKHRTQIDALFSKGKSLKRYPVKLVYYPIGNADNHKVGVSVPKRQFKKAVERNRLKRLLRESYRLNKHEIQDKLDTHAIMIIYIGRKPSEFKQISKNVKMLLQDLVKISAKKEQD